MDTPAFKFQFIVLLYELTLDRRECIYAFRIRNKWNG